MPAFVVTVGFGCVSRPNHTLRRSVSAASTRRGRIRFRSCANPPAPATPPSEGAPGWRELEQSWRFEHRDQLPGQGDKQSSLDCPECRATGFLECKFCGATGVLTVGDTLLCSVSGSTSCPVCKGTGECKCRKCTGSGQIAKWIVL